MKATAKPEKGAFHLVFERYWSPITFCLMWLGLVVVALYTRPAMPVDETRYLAVAWEMWLRGDFIVPHLNGETYSHKPPLLFWAMNLGWMIFGVNDWWPPLVAPFFSLASLFLSRAMAQKLWPSKPLIADLAPIMLLGAAFWCLYTTVTMFDMLVSACTLMGLYGLLLVWRDGNTRGWVWLGLGIGLGILAKGPVILLQILPIAVMAPLWDRERMILGHLGSWKRWYLGILKGVLGGAVIGLAWAIPAGIMGGEEYRNAIFWGQTAGRVVDSFAHARPWWWYLAVIGPLLLPWMIWPIWWKRLFKEGRALFQESQIRFCLLWFIPIFIAFSLISGKQLHYLLPIFPAFAFLLCRLLVDAPDHLGRWTRVLPAGFMGILALALGIIPFLGLEKLPAWVGTLSGEWMILVGSGALALALYPLSGLSRNVMGLSGMMVAFMMGIHLLFAPYLASSFALYEFSGKIKDWQDQGYDVAFVANYHGTFQFLGRLEQPIQELATEEGMAISDFVKAHPRSKVITMWKDVPPDHPAVEAVQDFRSRNLIAFDVQKLGGDISYLQRN